MASLVKIDTTNQIGNRAHRAVELIRQGVGILEELDGVRAQAIGDSQATMASTFGTATNDQAQALSDRWSAFLAAYGDSGNAEMGKLRDLADATVPQ